MSDVPKAFEESCKRTWYPKLTVADRWQRKEGLAWRAAVEAAAKIAEQAARDADEAYASQCLEECAAAIWRELGGKDV